MEGIRFRHIELETLQRSLENYQGVIGDCVTEKKVRSEWLDTQV